MAVVIAFDKASYAAGDTITVTVNDPALVESEAANYTESDGDIVTTSTTIQHQPLALKSSTGRTYKLVSVTGAVAVYTATA